MELLLNDLSLHGQFPDIPAFKDAVGRLMAMRQSAQLHGREIRCNRSLSHSTVVGGMVLPQVVNQFTRDERQVFLQWVTKHGPFWEADRRHGPDDYLECRGEVVTNSAVGEAAYCCLRGSRWDLVSFSPSDWETTPIAVQLILDDDAASVADVDNHWEEPPLVAALEASPRPVSSWPDLEAQARSRFPSLAFGDDCFASLFRYPFAAGAARQIMVLLGTLQDMRLNLNPDGSRTDEGHRLYQDHFTGAKAWFSDSSASEKAEFQKELTFGNPLVLGEQLFCTWHGKVKSPQIRIHFDWPIPADGPVLVAYVGPKITKRR